MPPQFNQANTIIAHGLDRIPIWKTGSRKWFAFRTVSQKLVPAPLSQEDFIARWSAIQNSAAQSMDLREMTVALWKMESLGALFGRLTRNRNTLQDPRLPREVGPIAHVGLGVAAVEIAGFDPAGIIDMIEALAHPDFRLFAYESLGAMLGAYEITFPKGLLGLKPHRRPEPRGFINFFASDIQRLISHGYGRILYFSSINISAAVRKIAGKPFLQQPAAVQGLAFAYAMVNHQDLWHVLDPSDGFEMPELNDAFRDGLIYALEFWEWAAPGFLQALKAPSSRSSELIAVARQEIASSRARGFPGAFLVEASSSF